MVGVTSPFRSLRGFERYLLATVEDSRQKDFHAALAAPNSASLRKSVLGSLLWQPHSVQQVHKTWIGVQIVKLRIDLDEENTRTIGKRFI